jgi:hypothetical protein
MLENMLKCTKASKRVQKHVEMCQSMPKCAKAFESKLKCAKAHKSARMHVNCVNAHKNVPKHAKMCESKQKCVTILTTTFCHFFMTFVQLFSLISFFSCCLCCTIVFLIVFFFASFFGMGVVKACFSTAYCCQK